MMKRIFALLLCLLMLVSSFCACAAEEEKRELTPEEEAALEQAEEDAKGAVINMYLTEMIYDFDPANAYNNEAALKVISLLYEPLFYLNDEGKIESNLVKSYEITEDETKKEYKLSLHLADTYWSDGTYVSANDVVYSWKRLLETEASYAAACLLFDIKNARLANQGDTSIDNIGLSAPNDKLVEVFFEGRIDYDQFLLNLTSYALAPLRENLATKTSYYEIPLGVDETGEMQYKVVRRYDDWAKKSATMASSGPFKLRTTEYPDDPAVDDEENYILGENGEFLYYNYATNPDDPSEIVRLEEGIYYTVAEDGTVYAYSEAALLTLQTENPSKYLNVISTYSRMTADPSEYATTPQNNPQIILERNSYYFKNMDDDNWKVDAKVVPYRLVIDYSKSDADLMAAYENGEIFYVGNIPLSMREQYASSVSITEALSTHTYYLNENAIIKYTYIDYDDNGLPILYDKVGGKQYVFNATTGAVTSVGSAYEVERDADGNIVYYTADGKKVYSSSDTVPILGENILANVDVRNALSLVIDREAIAKLLVFAEAANALVPTGVFESDSAKSTFRANGSACIATTADQTKALEKLNAAAIGNASDYKLTLSYAAYDEVHVLIAETVAAAWEEVLGFEVELTPLRAIENEDYWTTTEELLSDVKDDMWLETLKSGEYEIMAMDMVAFSADPFGVLAPFATLFSGMGMDMQNFDEYGEPEYIAPTHITGFSDAEYDKMIEKAFAEKDIAARAAILHEAETYLMTKMPVIPIVYNKNATLVNSEMLTDYEGNYYAPAGFIDCYLKGTPQYENHVAGIRNTVIIVVAIVLVVGAVVFFTVRYRIKAKKREEEIARISAEHEAKLREIRRPGSSRG